MRFRLLYKTEAFSRLTRHARRWIVAVTAMVAISFGQQATSAELTFETPREQAIAIDAPSTTGLEKVYVLATAEGVRAKFTADSPESICSILTV